MYSGYGMGYGLDPTFILIIIGSAIAMMASAKMQSTFAKFSQIQSKSGLTGAQVARMILDSNGLQHIQIIPIAGNLTDHYNPSNNTIALSETVINSSSLAAVSVAAHECGHAVQRKNGYFPYIVRSAIVPVVNFGQNLSIPIFMLGWFLGSTQFLMPIGLILFSFGLVFQIVTLPVEYDASSRALDLMEDRQILARDEIGDAKKVLNAAALTYVAGVIATALSFLRLFILMNSRRNRD